MIASADLDVDLWDVPAITAAVNASLRDMLPDDDDPDFVPDDTVYDFEDFVETVAEHPRPLKDLGLWPPPPPDTGGVDPARDARYAQWEADYDAARPDIDSDDYAGRQPIWEAEPDGAEDRLARLARAEPLDTAQQATVAAIRSHDVVAGWVRQTDADPCQLCQFWYRDGYVWPKDKQFQRHTGCNCQPKIVLAEHTRERIAS